LGIQVKLIIKSIGSTGTYESQHMRFPSRRVTINLFCNNNEIEVVEAAEKVAEIYFKKSNKTKTKKIKNLDFSKFKIINLPIPINQQETKNQYVGYYLSDELMTVYFLFKNQENYYIELRLLTLPIRIINDTAQLPFGSILKFKRNQNNFISGFILDLPRASNISFIKYDQKPTCY
jgi:hypothetical protein